MCSLNAGWPNKVKLVSLALVCFSARAEGALHGRHFRRHWGDQHLHPNVAPAGIPSIHAQGAEKHRLLQFHGAGRCWELRRGRKPFKFSRNSEHVGTGAALLKHHVKDILQVARDKARHTTVCLLPLGIS